MNRVNRSSRLVLMSGLLATVLFSLSCAPRKFNVQNGNSDIQATSQSQAGQADRCGIIYPSVKKVAIPIFQRIVEVARTGNASPTAVQLARQSVRMLENIGRHPTDPIHPLAFFSVVKDFESAADVDSWGMGGFGFTTGNCTSGVCSGYFQVDVAIEPAWNNGAVCKAGGLDIWNMKGGPDFCAAMFWWIQAAGGAKCEALARGNPCKDDNYTWTVETFSRGYEAYVQQPQWGVDSWGKMYSGGPGYHGYKQCVESVEGASLRTATDRFYAEIGAGSPGASCKNTKIYASDKNGYVQFQVNKPEECEGTKVLVHLHGNGNPNWVHVPAHVGDGTSGPKQAEHPFQGNSVRFAIPHSDLVGIAREVRVAVAKNSDQFAKIDHPFATPVLECANMAFYKSPKPDGIQFQVDFSPTCPATKVLIHMKGGVGEWIQVAVHPGDGTLNPKEPSVRLNEKIGRFFIPTADLVGNELLVVPATFQDPARGEERFGEHARVFR